MTEKQVTTINLERLAAMLGEKDLRILSLTQRVEELAAEVRRLEGLRSAQAEQ